MFDAYRRLLPSLGGYLTFAGELHRGRLEKFLRVLGEQEADVLESRAADAEDYDNKKSRPRGGTPAWANAAPQPAATATELDEDDAFALEMARLALEKEGHELELLAAVEGEVDPADPAAPAEPAGPTMMSKAARALFLDGDKAAGLVAWRNRYYKEKFKIGAVVEQQRKVVEAYMQGGIHNKVFTAVSPSSHLVVIFFTIFSDSIVVPCVYWLTFKPLLDIAEGFLHALVFPILNTWFFDPLFCRLALGAGVLLPRGRLLELVLSVPLCAHGLRLH